MAYSHEIAAPGNNTYNSGKGNHPKRLCFWFNQMFQGMGGTIAPAAPMDTTLTSISCDIASPSAKKPTGRARRKDARTDVARGNPWRYYWG